MKHSSTLSLTLLASTLLFVFVEAAQPAFALTYQAGVKPGDWWQYGDVTGYCQNPCQILGLASDLNVATILTRVTGVAGANVSVTATITFANGTSTVNSYAGDLSTGQGNLPDGIALIAANLSPGDPIFNSAYAPTLNATTLGTYAGAIRQANIWNDTHTQPAGDSTLYFDKTTGIILGGKTVFQGASLAYRVTGTSLWPYIVAIRDHTFCAPTDLLCKFDPANITIDQGTTVEWNNTGQVAHTVTSCSGINFLPLGCPLGANLPSLPSFDSGPVYPGYTFSSVFNVPGNYSYYCVIHPWLRGTIQVRPNTNVGNVGVSPGEWAKYYVSDTWNSTPQIPPPQPFLSYANISSIKIQVTSTSGNNATASLATSYQNGTVQGTTVTGSVLDGRPPLDPWIIAAGAALHFNYTSDWVYAGGVRLAGVLNVTTVSGTATARAIIVWDNATGLLLEETVTVHGGYGPSGTISGALHIKITQTNAWTPVQPPTVIITGLTPNPATTSKTVTVNFNIISSAQVSAITVNWGDGTTTHPSPAATSDTHIYLSTDSVSQTFTINVTATNFAGIGFAVAEENVNDQAPTVAVTGVSPSPVTTGQTVRVNFTASDPDGAISIISVDWGDSSTPDLILSNPSGSMCQRLNPYLNSNACTIGWGDLILARSQDPSTIANNTIIVFRPYPAFPNYLVVHRIIRIIPASQTSNNLIAFWTQGDANSVMDAWDSLNGGVSASQVVGVYQYTLAASNGILTAINGYDTHTYAGTSNSRTETFRINITATDNGGSTSSAASRPLTVNSPSSHISPAPNILGLAPAIFYSVIGIIAATVTAITLLALRQKRKSLHRIDSEPR
ncbi:MAG TPA: plastocyanin/azurin family copper-binding protein [Candidatus Angelobacter sp.]|nr:plastocyanin/azurin family copper-binding protein [Candidatus Angelobacter sp.]